MQIDTFSHDNGLQLLVVIFPRSSRYLNELNAIQMSQLLIVIFPRYVEKEENLSQSGLNYS